MIGMKSISTILLLALLFATGIAWAQPQSDQQAGDQTKTDPNATKNAVPATKKEQKKKTAATAPAATSAVPATTSASPDSASAPAATAPASQSGSSAPVSKPATAKKPTSPASNAVMVWVNTGSGIYHKPGTHWYGKTKHGKYMTEADAIRAGYHAAAKE
jgi:predicted lipid-binding transport protein (Tim44 family)